MRRQFLRAALALGLAAAGAAALVVTDADAKVSFESGYTLEQTYNGALRYVRVDLGLKVTEKDPQAAYVMFDYKHPESGDKISSGSVEIVPASGAVKVVVQIPQMPRYHEQALADGLQKKLRAEYGEPPKKPPPPAPTGSSDAGPDGG